MPVIYPTDEISQRWNGALDGRLRRAPLERFLQRNSLALAPAGRLQLSENLLKATVFIVERALEQHHPAWGLPAPAHGRSAVGHLACVVSRALADEISEPLEWRVAALRCTAQLLRAQSGLSAAATAAASLVRGYCEGLSEPISEPDRKISERVCALLKDTSAAARESDWMFLGSCLQAASSRPKDSRSAHALETGARS